MILILVLSTLSSGTSFASAELVPENFEPVSTSKHFTIDLKEDIGFTETKKQLPKFNHFNVSLQEKIAVFNESAREEIVLIKHDSDKKALLERIFDRQSKIKTNELKLLEKFSSSTLAYHEIDTTDDQSINQYDLSFDGLFFELDDLILNINTEFLISNYFPDDQIISSQINVDFLIDQIFDPENPILLILLIPFAGFILIRYDNEQIKFYRLKQFFTLIFVVLLVSSAVITPMSISSSYWGYAFADMDNSTEILSSSNSDNITQENITQTNNTTKINVKNCFRQ